jgi:hypothetical protein
VRHWPLSTTGPLPQRVAPVQQEIPHGALALEGASVVGDSALHSKASAGMNREGHGGLAGRPILGEGSIKPQDGGYETKHTVSLFLEHPESFADLFFIGRDVVPLVPLDLFLQLLQFPLEHRRKTHLCRTVTPPPWGACLTLSLDKRFSGRSRSDFPLTSQLQNPAESKVKQ